MLLHYLWGGGAFFERNWRDYMEASPRITTDSALIIISQAQAMANMPIGASRPVNVTTHTDAGGGEGITGYSYLGGSNKDVGDFHVYGNATKQDDCSILFSLSYEFNDKTDPNLMYPSDAIKAALALIISNGRARSFRTSIWWVDKTVYRIKPGKHEGWPLIRKSVK